MRTAVKKFANSSKVQAKRSQNVNATYRNIVGRNMLGRLATMLRPVVTCWVLLDQM